MRTKNLLAAGLLLMTAFALTPNATAGPVEDALEDITFECVEAVCGFELPCELKDCVVCPVYAGSSPLCISPPVCTMSSYACPPCPPPPPYEVLTSPTTMQACTLPCTTYNCVPCLDSIAISDLAATIRCPGPVCDDVTNVCGVCDWLSTGCNPPCQPARECLPTLPPICKALCDPCEFVVCDFCTAAFPYCPACPDVPGGGDTGQLPKALAYADEMGQITCQGAKDLVLIGQDQADLTLAYVQSQIPYMTCCYNVEVPGYGLVEAATDMAEGQFGITCGFVHPTLCTSNGSTPGDCPAPVDRDAGGLYGDVLRFAGASCDNTEGGAAAIAGGAGQAADDAVATAEALAALAQYYAEARLADAQAYAGATQDNADAAAASATGTAGAAVAATCTYTVGNPTCSL